MDVLTDLYSDPKSTVLREYSANALDAIVEAGSDKPVVVDLPNSMSQNLVIRDEGIGLTMEQIVEVFGTYGASTKRDSNDYIGCLGLGSKSALAYTNSFVVTSIKDGVEATVQFFRDPQAAGKINEVYSGPTDKPNGTTVTIPTQRFDRFDSEAKEVFQFWPQDKILINGEKPYSFFDDENKTVFDMGNGVFIYSDTYGYRPTNYIVMGNIGYVLKTVKVSDAGLNDLVYHDLGVVIFADIGEVDFTPNREQLNYNEKTDAFIRNSLSSLDLTPIQEEAQRRIDEAETPAAAFSLLGNKIISFGLGSSRRNGTLTWRGHEINSKIDTEEKVSVFDLNHFDEWGSPCVDHQRTKFRIDTAPNSMFITGRPEHGARAITKSMKNKIAKYLDDNSLTDVRYVIFTDQFEEYPWDECPEVTWEDMKAIELPKAVREKTVRDPNEAPVYTYWENGIQRQNSLDETKEIVLISKESDHDWDRLSRAKAMKDKLFVKVAGNRVEKFKRLYPQYKKSDEVIKDIADSLPDLTSDQQVAYNLRHSMSELGFFAGICDDPRFQKYVDIHDKGDIDDIIENRKAVGLGFTSTDTWNYENDYHLLHQINTFSMIHYGGSEQVEHLKKYMNMIYKGKDN